MKINEYPSIARIVETMGRSNNMVRFSSTLEHLLGFADDALEEGGYSEDNLKASEVWLESLTEEQFETFADGDVDEIERMQENNPAAQRVCLILASVFENWRPVYDGS